MTLRNTNNTVAYISKWLNDYCNDNGRKTLVVGYDKTYNSGILLYVAMRGVSGDIKSLASIEDTKSLLSTHRHGIGLKVVAFSKDDQVHLSSWYHGEITLLEHTPSVLHLISIAEESDGIVLGNVDKTFGEVNREYSKVGQGLCDVFPIYDLFYSELKQIADGHIQAKFEENVSPGDGESDYEYVSLFEWALRNPEVYGLITDPKVILPQSSGWFRYTIQQRTVIAFLHNRNKSTYHKRILRPYPVILTENHR